MGRIKSRLSKVMVCGTSNGTFLEVNGAKELTFSGNRSEIKCTGHDDGDFENYIAGRIDGSIDMKLFYDDTVGTTTGQGLVNDAWFNGTPLFVHFVMSPKTGGKCWTGSAIVTKHEEAGGDNDVAMLNTTLRIAGAFANTTQTAADATVPGVVGGP